MAAVNESGIVNLPCTAIIIYEGHLYKFSSGQMALQTDDADPVVIAVESSVDDLGDAKTLTAGETMPFFVPGCGKIVKVASLTGITYTLGCAVYNCPDGSTDGLCCVTATTATLIGHYMGPNSVATTKDGDLVDVLLDAPIGGI